MIRPIRHIKHEPIDGWDDGGITNRLVLEYTPKWPTNPPQEVWTKVVYIPEGIEAEEYARLFAASLDLLSALENLLAWAEKNTSGPGVEQARAAIHKAKHG